MACASVSAFTGRRTTSGCPSQRLLSHLIPPFQCLLVGTLSVLEPRLRKGCSTIYSGRHYLRWLMPCALGLWQKPVQPEDLEWEGAGHTPLHAGSEEATGVPQAATVQVTTAPERDAAAMSDHAAWQWVEDASALPCMLPTANGSITGHALQVSTSIALIFLFRHHVVQ